MPQPTGAELDAIRARRDELRGSTCTPVGASSRAPRAASTTRRSSAATSSETIRFYQDFLGFPLVELVENRDYAGSSHFFFDLGNRNLLGFFDFPGHDHPPFEETIGALQHMAISVSAEQFAAAKAKLDDARRRLSRPGPRRRRQHVLPRPERDRVRALPRGTRRLRGDPLLADGSTKAEVRPCRWRCGAPGWRRVMSGWMARWRRNRRPAVAQSPRRARRTGRAGR